jgi:peptide/nickel transport system permease protein
MPAFIARRVLAMVPVLVLISLISFLTLRILPGDPARGILGPEAPIDAVRDLHKSLGLDRPLPQQYGSWAAGTLKGDFGRTYRTGQTVSSLIGERLPVTIELAVLAIVISTLIGIPLGILAAIRANTIIDYVSTAIAVAGAVIPNFWLALLLVLLFSVRLGWFPALGWTSFSQDPVQNLKSATLPAVALGVAQAAALARMTRSAMVEVLKQDYIRTARAKGLPGRRVVMRHALKNSLIPITTIFGLQVSRIIGGAIIIETIFALPGIGKLVIDSILFRELTTVQALVLIIAAWVVLSNLFVDISYAYLDPRIHYG